MDENKDKKLVVKQNKLIEFRGRMTTNELKLFSLIISDVREQQEEQFKEYLIDISVLQETTKDKNFYGYIVDVAVRLEGKILKVEKLNKDSKNRFTTIRLINKPSYTEGSKYLSVNIDRDLIPYIIDLKREFTRYQIENILRLKSSYSIRLYELLKQYENIGIREIDINDLREYLGIELDEYKRFTNFESRVLITAKLEINGEYDENKKTKREGTDINIEYEKVKKGKNITSIIFKIKSKESKDKVYIAYLKSYYNIKDLKKKMGLGNENMNDKQIMQLYEIAIEKTQDTISPFDYIRLNFLHVKSKGSVRNIYAYLMSALESDYASASGQISLLNLIE